MIKLKADGYWALQTCVICRMCYLSPFFIVHIRNVSAVNVMVMQALGMVATLGLALVDMITLAQVMVVLAATQVWLAPICN